MVRGTTPCPKKVPPNSTDFQNSFTTRKRKKFPIKSIYFPPHLKYVAALLLGITKFKFVVKLQNKIKQKSYHICQKMSFIHMAEWILLLSQQLLEVSNACSHTYAKTMSVVKIALSMTLWSILC